MILKNSIPTDEKHSAQGGDNATINYEYSFSPLGFEEERIIAPFSAFVPYFRGRRVANPPPLDKKHVRRMNLMVRSFFGKEEQEGPFSITFLSVEVGGEEQGWGSWLWNWSRLK